MRWGDVRYQEVDVKDTSTEATIRSIIEARSAAMRRGDVETATAHVAEDIATFDVIDPLRYEGNSASRERATAWLASFDGPIDLQNLDVQITRMET